MKFKSNRLKKISTIALASSIAFSSLAISSHASASTIKDYNKKFGISHITREDMSKIPNQQDSNQFKVPTFDASTIKNIPSAKAKDASGNEYDLDVWDSWPLQNADGTIATYHGYHVVFALAGNPKNQEEAYIYMFYQKIGETSIDSWKNAGRVFKDSDKFVPNDAHLSKQTQEWSGSTTLTSDGKIRLFYTDFSGSPETGGTGDSNQIITTAQINVSEETNTLKINGVEDHKSIFDGGDGTLYQNIQQFRDEGMFLSNDNHTLRDPHYVEDKGHKYLVFEANTGTEDGYQGEDSLYNKAYYGKTAFFKDEKTKLLQSSKKHDAELANGALGIIELNKDYTLKKVMKPLITSNTVTDEIERANIFKKDGKWYLFTDSRGAKMTIDGIDSSYVYMLGFQAPTLTGKYKPLNDTGLVLSMNLDPNDRTFTYSHFVVPNKDSDNLVVTSYMTNKGLSDTEHSTFAPSFLLNLKGTKTSVVQNSILEQGQLTSK